MLQAWNYTAATTAMAVDALVTGSGAPQENTIFTAIIAVPFSPLGRRALLI